MFRRLFIILLLLLATFSIFLLLSIVFPFNPVIYQIGKKTAGLDKAVIKVKDIFEGQYREIDHLLYDKKMIALANNPQLATSSTSTIKNLWPVKNDAYPLGGAILPFHRIVAYYGNFYSKNMGVLGQYPPDEMISRLSVEVKKWQEADPEIPVIPAIHYIAVTAQGMAGTDNKYRLRMPDDQIQKAIDLAGQINGLVFLDIQVGQSNLEAEIPALEKYLKLPQVHLAIDPEFSMKSAAKPGSIIGTMDANDINYATNFLAKIVNENHLPPKILIVHRFTQNMVTNYQNIKLLPEVQIVMDMDGWGPEAKKIGTYKQVIFPYPVQFAGFKLFYKNDTLSASSSLLVAKDLLKLRPIPIYIQYQ